MIDRRELLHRTALMLGGALSASAVAGILGGCTTTEADAAPQAASGAQKLAFFSPAEAAAVTGLAEQILPRTDTPGATDVGVPAFIDRMMANFYQAPEQAALRAGLVRADQEAKAAHGKTFAALTSDQQVALMQVWDKEAYAQNRLPPTSPPTPPHFFRMMKELTTLGFFTSEVGAAKFLKYAPIPGPYRGDIPYSDVGAAWSL